MDPVINVDEKIGKTVGRRVPRRQPLDDPNFNIKASEEWRAAMGGVPVPRGVFKFNSHEEADAWMREMLTRKTKV